MENFAGALDLGTVLFLIVAGFISAFIDSTVGGGGLISTPALLSLGLPVPYALGTNKVAASVGSLTSVISFWRAGKIKKAALALTPLSFIGSALGAYVVYLLPEKLMKNIIVVLLVLVAVYTYRRKDWGDTGTVQQLGAQALAGAFVMAFAIGFYDGFFGPGTGSFLIFGFLYLGYDFVTAAGNAKALNFASGVGALVSFAVSGTIIWSYGVIMALAMMIGAVFGSRMAIKKGASYVRPLYLLVTTLLIGKQVYEILLK
ncbi:TSUP family transporter [uncultured Phascolarctobacterium sp.]|uniref:TSUP family transporter n=1 Tax=uncultured Phascolarctobacterium sp. TaxID=512296 RepID=UPI0025F215F6|nr:TSUP family transporter [uncultured Phascolarctobacterium sp.]